MKDGFIKVAAVTPKIKVADPAYNAEVVIEELNKAYEKDAKLIVFPELVLSGYTCNDLFLQERLQNEVLEALEKVMLATEEHDAIVFVGMPFTHNGKLYNVAVAIQDGFILGIVPKRWLPNYGEFYEARYFTPGKEEVENIRILGQYADFGRNLLFACQDIPGFVIGCEICEDLWVPNPPSTGLALAGATVMVNLSASDETVAKEEYRRMLVKATSARLVSAYIYTSAAEGESSQDLVFGGHNLIAEYGSVLAESGRFTAESVYTDIDISRLINERRKLTTFVPENEDKYTKETFRMKLQDTRLERRIDPMPFVPTDKNKRDHRCEEILSIQAYGLKKRYEHTGCKKAVLGISGGLDSTLALLVVVRAFDLLGLDRKGILSVTMPCFGTTKRTKSNAVVLSEKLGVTLKEVNIEKSVLQHFEDIEQSTEVHDVTYENGQARERTQVLMDIANKEGALVIGTGDMSELALGWATYNGDHMSMYGVNVGVPKTLVRHLVAYYSDTCGDAELSKVLNDILDTPVSPELLPPKDGEISQKTEDLVGPYELHDFFMYYVLRMGFEPAKIYRMARKAFDGMYDEETIKKWIKTFYRRFFSQQFKRSCLPDGPKVGSVAVSPRGDLRMPSDASASAWLKQLETL